MQIRLLFISSTKEEWFESALETYQKKIKGFMPFEIQKLKAKNLARESAANKKILESQALLNVISDKDFVILFDERGQSFSNSIDYSKALKKAFESGKRSVVLITGGAYGSSEELKERADKVWSLSSLTMNHMLATTVVLEQTYRALTIQNNIPYHNE